MNQSTNNNIPAPSEQLYNLFIAPDTPYGSYPFGDFFDLSTPEATRRTMSIFRQCMEEAIAIHRAELHALGAGATEPATFENTILAHEKAGEALEAVAGAFYNLLSTASCDEMMQLAETFSEWLSRLGTDTLLDEAIFSRIKAVYDQRDSLGLDEIDRRLLQERYESFADNGALLQGKARDRFREINERLSQLTERFAQNKLHDEEEWHRFVSIKERETLLSGIPKPILADARQKAEQSPEYDEEGYLFDLSAPHVSAILKHCTDSELRREFYEARSSVGNRDNDHNNQQIVREIVSLRRELANLLGHPNYATYALKHRMCSTPAAVQHLLDEIVQHYRPVAKQELAEIEAQAGKELEPWDHSFYIERHIEQHYQIKEEEMRPYFPLSQVLRGVLGIATRLYGISFRPVHDVPLYHPDVKTYTVHDEDDSYLGLLYLDFFPRKGKHSGAWMNDFRECSPQRRPHVVLVMNFTPPTPGKEALLTLQEVHTLLHEFGHSLHSLLTQARYSSLSGTNVERDFVELPSQFMENFLRRHSIVTSLLSQHYETGEPIPTTLLDKALQAQQYPVGYSAIRQIIFGKVDMAYHSLTADEEIPEDLIAFEDAALDGVRIKKDRDERKPRKHLIGTSFSHIFSGGYASGYYGYKWSEMLEADAFERFEEEGLFDPSVAKSFRQNILERGDEADPMDLYIRFRGHHPSISAMLRRDQIGE